MKISKSIQDLEEDFPQFTFLPGPRAYWSPETQEIYYSLNFDDEASSWSLFHELGHAVLGHKSYTTDIDLLKKELDAWTEANRIATKYDLSISEEYAQNCLETYRNWLYKRSTCPVCGAHGIQNTNRLYCCLNCDGRWHVSTSRFCRPYRGKAEKDSNKKSQENNSWLFVENTP